MLPTPRLLLSLNALPRTSVATATGARFIILEAEQDAKAEISHGFCRNCLTKQWNLLEKSGICTANIGGDVPEVSMHFHQFRYSSP